jgi:hypothetical protein
MTQKNNKSRLYPCKDEELPILAGFVAFSLKRDAKDFASYSSIFAKDFIKRLEADIKAASGLVRAGARGAIHVKGRTKELYEALDGLLEASQSLKVYLKLAGLNAEGGAKEFAITKLSHAVNRKDAEGVLAESKVMEEAIVRHKSALAKAGMTDKFIKDIRELQARLNASIQNRYEAKSARAAGVLDNIDALNSLYVKLTAVCDVGKIIYKKSDPAKVKEYTFSALKRRVRAAGTRAGGEKKNPGAKGQD